MERKISVKSLHLLLVISIGLIGLGIGSTYAVFTANAEINNPIVFNSNLSHDSEVIETIEIEVPAGETVSSTLNISNTSGGTLNYVVWYLDSGLEDVELGTNSGTPTGSLGNNGSTSVIVDIRNNGTSSVTITLGISSSSDSVVLGNGMFKVSSEVLPSLKTTLVDYITNLYLNNKDAELNENNGIAYRYSSIYKRDDDDTTSGGLMNDRHGSMDIGEDDGNIRYYGANPNNYIYFNCSDYSNQSESTCEVWRIIGVFDGKVKIMRNGSIGDLAWDQDKNQNSSLTTFNNDWSTSSLQEFLNGKYYDRGEEITYTYYTEWDGSSTGSINLENIGIKNDTTRGLISETLWYLKGWDSSSIYSDQMYDYERNSGNVAVTEQPTTMPGNIAIPYASDYGYAVDFGSCSQTLYDYDNTACTSENWMKPILGTSTFGWLMAPYSSSSVYAWLVSSSGYVVNSFYGVCNASGVAPVLHLNSELGIKTGDGSQETPYQIAIG